MAAVSMFTELAELPIAKQADAVQRKINEQGFDLLSSLVAELALMNSVPRGYPFQTAILALHASPLDLDPNIILGVLRAAGMFSDEGQLQAVQAQISNLCRRLLTSAQILMPDVQRAVVGVIAACLRAAALSRVLTPVHAHVLEWALSSGMLPEAAAFAAEPVLDIMPTFAAAAGPGSGITTEVTSYLYLCGTALAAVRRWPEAADAYRTSSALGQGASGGAAASAGSGGGSAGNDLKQESLRKWLLCCLIGYGKLSAVPRHLTSSLPAGQVSRLEATGLSKVYVTIAKAADQEDVGALFAASVEHAGIIQADGNTDLVHELITSCLLRRVAKLGETYDTVSLAQVVQALHHSAAPAPTVQEAADWLLRGIATGQLQGTFDAAAGRLTFTNNSSAASSVLLDDAAIAALQEEVTSTHELLSTLRSADRQLTLQPAVLRKFVQGGRTGSGRGGAGRRGAGAGLGLEHDVDMEAGDWGGTGGMGMGMAMAMGRGMTGAGVGGGMMSEQEQMEWAMRDSLSDARR